MGDDPWMPVEYVSRRIEILRRDSRGVPFTSVEPCWTAEEALWFRFCFSDSTSRYVKVYAPSGRRLSRAEREVIENFARARYGL